MSAVLVLVALLAQAPAPQVAAAPTPDAPQLDRIREAVAEAPSITIPVHPDDDGKPVFRVRIQAWTFSGRPWDQNAKSVPDYVRPSMPLYHYEYLQMTTPEAFRASTLYPGFAFDPGELKKAYLRWRHAAAEQRAREEVRRDFEAYLQARAATDR
jgi:hypothetical protein